MNFSETIIFDNIFQKLSENLDYFSVAKASRILPSKMEKIEKVWRSIVYGFVLGFGSTNFIETASENGKKTLHSAARDYKKVLPVFFIELYYL